MAISLLVASSDEHFRETIRESLVNLGSAKVVAEYPAVSSNLYIRVLQDLERYPEAALIVDDIELNCTAAAELGMSSVWFRSNEQAIEEIERALD